MTFSFAKKALILLVSIVAVSLACDKDKTATGPENVEGFEVYVVDSIDGKSMEYALANFFPYLPLMLDVQQDSTGTSVLERVKFAHLGWLPINKDYLGAEAYHIDAPDSLLPVEAFYIYYLEIIQNRMSGTFVPGGRTIDALYYPFTAHLDTIIE